MESENKVLEMFRAIRKGRNYSLEIEGANNTGECRLQFASDSFSLKLLEGWETEIDDPRTAREIAGILVTWANAKEGRSFTGEEMDGAMTLFGWANVQDIHHPVNQTRAKWYDDMVGIMTTDTLKRNYADLRILAKRLARENAKHDTGWNDLSDVRRAIGVCHSEFRDRGYAICTKWCDNYFPEGEIHEHVKSCRGDDRV